jgi:hypothetical protein
MALRYKVTVRRVVWGLATLLSIAIALGAERRWF